MSMRIFRISNIFSWSLAILLGSALFWVSQSVQRAENDLRRLNASVNLELEAIRVLEAEWDFLNSPMRLEDLAWEYLQVDEIAPTQVMDEVSDIPSPDIPVIPSVKPIPVHLKAPSPKQVAAAPKPKISEPAYSPPKDSAVIRNADRNNFNDLLKDITQEAAR